jgi:hypothetical protein
MNKIIAFMMLLAASTSFADSWKAPDVNDFQHQLFATKTYWWPPIRTEAGWQLSPNTYSSGLGNYYPDYYPYPYPQPETTEKSK